MNSIYKFELPWGIAIVCAENKNRAKEIFWEGDGDEMSGKEYFYGKKLNEVIYDDEPYLVDIGKTHVIAFHCW